MITEGRGRASLGGIWPRLANPLRQEMKPRLSGRGWLLVALCTSLSDSLPCPSLSVTPGHGGHCHPASLIEEEVEAQGGHRTMVG